MNPKADFFFEKDTQWQEAYKALRSIILECGLTEEVKWGCPCYTHHDNNVVLIHGFKEYCALLFHKGVLLKDTEGVLIQQTENVQSARQMRFTNTQQILDLKDTIKAYVFEAVEVEKAGLQVPMKKTREYEVPEELDEAFAQNPDLMVAFEALTPGRQRGYYLHFSQPKQSKTRVARIEKCTPHIFLGKGYNER